MKRYKTIGIIIGILIGAFVLYIAGNYLFQMYKVSSEVKATLRVHSVGACSYELEYTIINKDNQRITKTLYSDKTYEKVFEDIKEIRVNLKPKYGSCVLVYTLMDKNEVVQYEELRSGDREVKTEYKF